MTRKTTATLLGSEGMEIPYTIERFCPLCEHKLPHSRWLLYDFQVCPKCYNDLASRRVWAFLVDVICFWALTIGFVRLASPPAVYKLHLFLATLVLIVLFAFKDGFRGRSPGKWMLGLQVIHGATHEPIGFATSFRRNLPIAALDVAHLAALMVPLLSKLSYLIELTWLTKLVIFLLMAVQLHSGPRWGDGLAGTKVIRTSLAYRPPFDVRGVRCVSCGYDLTGNVSGVCPECGTPVSKLSPMNWHVTGDAGDQLSVTVARSQDHFADRG